MIINVKLPLVNLKKINGLQMGDSELQELDLNINWHPCSQMKDYEIFKPLIINKAYGCYLELSNGKRIIDAISSWWCKSLGHNNFELKQALISQINKFEHVIFANTTNKTIVDLSNKLISLMSNLNKVFYAGDGSCAVEIALKMSFQSRIISGQNSKNKFIALRNGYHGETIGAMSVSGIEIYRHHYSPLLFETIFVEPIYVCGTDDRNWTDVSSYWLKIQRSLEPYIETTTAIIVEPILQGAGGMRIYSKDFLSKLYAWAKKNNIHIIADEIMTGFGRTGKMLASEFVNIQPDFICLSKGLTSGWMPFSAVLTTDNMYQIFYDDYHTGKSFLHSHTYSGNALGASLALTTLNIILNNKLYDRANRIQKIMKTHMNDIAEQTGYIKNVRGIGGVVAADLISNNKRERKGYQVYKEAVRLGLLLRPLGDTIYWLPPLIVSEETLLEMKLITTQAILAVYENK